MRSVKLGRDYKPLESESASADGDRASCWRSPISTWTAIGAVALTALVLTVLVGLGWTEISALYRRVNAINTTSGGGGPLDTLAGTPGPYCSTNVSYPSFDWRSDGRVENPACHPFADVPVGGDVSGTLGNAELVSIGAGPIICPPGEALVDVTVLADGRTTTGTCAAFGGSLNNTGVVPGEQCNTINPLTVLTSIEVLADGRVVGSTCGDLSVKLGSVAAGGDLTGFYPNPTLVNSGPGALCYQLGIHNVCLDAKGRVSTVSAPGAALVTVSGPPTTSGTMTGTWSNLEMQTLHIGGPATYGGAYLVSFTRDQYGRVTNASDGDLALTENTVFAGAVQGTYNTLALADLGYGTGSVGSSTCIPIVSWDSNGLWAAAPTCVPIAMTGGSGSEMVIVGTTNQVIVTFDNITNITTLSTPQDIHIAANVQFHNGTFTGQLVLGPVAAASRQGSALHSASFDATSPTKKPGWAFYGTDSVRPYREEAVYQQGLNSWSYDLHGVAYTGGDREYTTIPSLGAFEVQYYEGLADFWAFDPAPTTPANISLNMHHALRLGPTYDWAGVQLRTEKGFVANEEVLPTGGRLGKNYNSFSGPPGSGRASVEFYQPGQALPISEVGGSTNAEYVILGGYVGADGLYHTRSGIAGSTLAELRHEGGAFSVALREEGTVSAAYAYVDTINRPGLSLDRESFSIHASNIRWTGAGPFPEPAVSMDLTTDTLYNLTYVDMYTYVGGFYDWTANTFNYSGSMQSMLEFETYLYDYGLEMYLSRVDVGNTYKNILYANQVGDYLDVGLYGTFAMDSVLTVNYGLYNPTSSSRFVMETQFGRGLTIASIGSVGDSTGFVEMGFGASFDPNFETWLHHGTTGQAWVIRHEATGFGFYRSLAPGPGGPVSLVNMMSFRGTYIDIGSSSDPTNTALVVRSMFYANSGAQMLGTTTFYSNTPGTGTYLGVFTNTGIGLYRGVTFRSSLNSDNNVVLLSVGGTVGGTDTGLEISSDNTFQNNGAIAFDATRTSRTATSQAWTHNVVGMYGYVIHKVGTGTLRVSGIPQTPAAAINYMEFVFDTAPTYRDNFVRYTQPIRYVAALSNAGNFGTIRPAYFDNEGFLRVSATSTVAATTPAVRLTDMELRSATGGGIQPTGNQLNGTLRTSVIAVEATTTVTLCLSEEWRVPASATSGMHLFAYDRRGATFDLIDSTFALTDELCQTVNVQQLSADGSQRITVPVTACLLHPLSANRGCQIRLGLGTANGAFMPGPSYRLGCISFAYML